MDRLYCGWLRVHRHRGRQHDLQLSRRRCGAGALSINRDFLNWAPEGGLLYRPNDAWQFRGRVATGYGTNIGNLTVTSAGVSGDNSTLQSQHNLGIDLGADWTPASWLKLSVTGFYEWFRDELVTQSPGAGLQNFTFNVRARSTRAWIWRRTGGRCRDGASSRPIPGSTSTTGIYRAAKRGRADPSVRPPRQQDPGRIAERAFARLGYDQPTGPWKGFGGFVEYVWKDTFYMENANLLRAPGYGLVNVNVHYDTEVMHPYLKGAIFFFEVKNVLDSTYVASANNITNSISAVTGLQNPGSVLATTGTGSIYAGAPRTYVAGMKLAFSGRRW